MYELGNNYSLTSIVNSELRIMNYLEYKLNLSTPHSYIQVLIEVLAKNSPELKFNVVYVVADKVLECFYLQREQIYDRLYETMTGRSRDASDRENFLTIERNYLYLAAAIIIASSYIYDSKNHYEMVGVIKSFSSRTNILIFLF